MSKETELLPDTNNELLNMGIAGITIGTLAKVFHPSPPIMFLGYAVGIGSFVFNALGKKNKEYDTIFQNCNLINKSEMLPQLKEVKTTKYGRLLRFSLPPGLSLSDFRREQEAIEQFLGHKISIKYKHKNILIEVYERELKGEYLFEIMSTKGIVEIVAGYSYKGVETIDLCPSKGNIHLLIAGQTGGGKSTLLRQIITTILLTKDINKISLRLLDLKGTEFQIFEGCSEMITSYATSLHGALKVIAEVKEEVDKRNNLFKKAGVVDILEYNKKFKNNQLKYELVIIDEFHLLRGDKKGVVILEELAAISRSAGIHLILCTQRPSADVITGLLKSNIPTVIGLKTLNGLNSRIIIEQDGLEDLKGRGNAILQRAGQNIEIQGMNLGGDQARELLKTLKRLKNKVNDKAEFIPVQKVKELKPVEKAGTVIDFDFLKKING